MRTRLAILALAFAAAAALEAQQPAAPAPVTSVCPEDAHARFHACAQAAMKTFTPPKTAAGTPDLSGLWRRRAAAHEDLEAHPKNADDAGGPSVVVDPADGDPMAGKVPMQPWADARRKENAQKFLHHNAACLLSGVPTVMFMTGLYQFQQTDDYLIVQSEEAHAWRIIPLKPQPPLGSRVQLLRGDSRGRWDGNTLVIETTNQPARWYLDQRGRFLTEEATVTERFTLVDANTLHYQATIDDPNVYTRPFTIAVAMRRNTQPNTEIWEEACFEDNAHHMTSFGKVGYGIYPGITAAEARELKKAFDAAGGAR
jgi:hypothetical protein